MLKMIAAVALGLLLLHVPANAKIHQWTDEKGSAHYSSEPPPLVRAVASSPSQDKSRARSFSLPQRGSLVLSVPESWDHELRQPPQGLPPTIVLTPREGDDFTVMITPLWSPKNEPGFNNSQTLKRLVSGDLAGMLPGAVEKEAPIVEIPGKYGVGYYFFVTDKAPGTGYPYAVRAGIGVGDLLLSVTVLCRTKDSEGLRQTLLALQGAEHKKE